MNYANAIKYLDGFSNYEKRAHVLKARFSLSPIKKLMKRMDNPHLFYPAIHVAGTVGKGSVSHSLSEVLTAAGYRTGLYTSPHLIDIRERIRIDGKKVAKKVFAEAVERVKEAVGGDVDMFTYFEVLTAAAFEIFSSQGVDIAVVESGLGGRLDTTNVVCPIVSVITTIGWDHQSVLGNRLSLIASEKAGIIKKRVPVVSAPQRNSAKRVLVSKAGRLKSELYIIKPNQYAVKNEDGSHTIKLSGINDFKARFSLNGDFQTINLGVVIKTIENLKEKGFEIEKRDIVRGLSKVDLQGRMQKIEWKGRRIVIDGAHNVTAVAALRESLTSEKADSKRIIIIAGIMKDKDVNGIMKELAGIGREIIVCAMPYDRAAGKEDLACDAINYFSKVHKADSMIEALKIALNTCDPKDLICITGSLYMASEALSIFMK